MPQKTLLGIRRQSWSFLLSVGAHGGLIAVLLYASFNEALELPQATNPISVVMVEPAATEAASAPQAAQPEPEPEPQVEAVKQPEPEQEPLPQPVAIPLPEPKPEPKPNPKPKTEPVKKKVEQPKKTQEKADEKQQPSPFTSEDASKTRDNAPVRQAPAPSASAQSSGPRPLSRVQPQYPARAFALRVEGRATLQFDVDSEGRVDNIRVLNAQPRNMFERDIRQAMRKWRYEAGKPGKDLQVTIIFKIDGGAVVE
ncbi:TonB system transport protein TonB [Candidatus Symbiopectobacterium sp.]|uniref:TonB system transport protein TonB n=1 Tax=Candidatus Symbiopectobacterium sp. TaxID=2816440 RepID=UPI0025C05714|nr:TonB system transport protein TonB [Candidatus Symbiopectobacterium sp.]